jgi:L-ascorbate metabolism protein UlaG (beta-lactamase superfamily)
MRMGAFLILGFATRASCSSLGADATSPAMTLPLSDHFNGKTFFNPGDPSVRGFLDVIKWRMTSKATPWPKHIEVTPRVLPPSPLGDGIIATWVGQSTFLIRSGSATVLTDPVWSETAGPTAWLGPRRVAKPGIDFDAVPKVDLVLLSHDHYDHCDLATLRRLAQRDRPVIVTPLRYGRLLSDCPFSRIVELDWWQENAPATGLGVTFVPSRHWTRRTPFDTNRRLWGGYMLRIGGRSAYFVGDSGYQEGLFPEINRRCGAPDLALIPIGAYEPRWFMASAHMNPPEAVRVHIEVGAKKSVAMHWGTFQLTDEGWDAPVHALDAALAGAGLDSKDFASPAIGTSVSA